MIEGQTPKEKHDNLKAILQGCEIICYPRRGTEEERWTIESAANNLVRHIKNPNAS